MHCVDLGESFPTSIYLQKSASIQPRTSPSKFGGNYSILFNRVLILDSAIRAKNKVLVKKKADRNNEARSGGSREGKVPKALCSDCSDAALQSQFLVCNEELGISFVD